MSWSFVTGTGEKADGGGSSDELYRFVIRSGEIIRWLGTSTDIDTQKQVERDLRRANQDLEQFAYSASHDLKEPLRNLVIYSELLRKGYRGQLGSEGEEFLSQVSEGAKRISAMLADLLAYTQAATLTTDVQPVNCTEIFQAVVRDLERDIKQSGATRYGWRLADCRCQCRSRPAIVPESHQQCSEVPE